MEKELLVAVEAAERAGEAIRAVYERPDFDVIQKADGKGPLTEADLASNHVILEAIAAAFPEDGVLSEESVDSPSRLAKRRVWIVDPLDGTREFTMRVPEFVVSIGLVVDGEAAVGVLYNPITDELFTGIVGGEATYRGAPCRVTNHGTIAGSRILVSGSEYRKGWFDGWMGEADLRPMGSVAYKFGRVAAGLAEATFTPRPRNEWDLCGGVACVRAAGGRATNGEGVDYTFNRLEPLHIGVCGTNGAIHEHIMGMMRR